MKHWLCVTNEKNWEKMKKLKIWGVPKRYKHTIEQVRRGDKLVIYLTGYRSNNEIIPPRIVAICEVESEPFIDHKKVFDPPKKKPNEVFPYRIKIKLIKIFDKPVEFKQLIPKLKFIKNHQNWKAYVRSSMRELPEDDFKTILSHGENS